MAPTELPSIESTRTFTSSISLRLLDGNNRVVLVNSGLNESVGIELDVAGGYFYVSDRAANKIIRHDLDGSNVTDALTISLNCPHNFALDLIGQQILCCESYCGRYFERRP